MTGLDTANTRKLTRGAYGKANRGSLAPPDIIGDAIEHLPQGIAVYDDDLNLLTWNTPFQRLLDLPDGFLRADMNLSDIVRFKAERGEYGKGDIGDIIANRLKRAASDEPYRFERKRPDGTFLETVGNPLPNGGWVVTCMDITERVRSEELALARSEKLRQQVLETTNQGYWHIDVGGRTVDVNPAMCRILEQPRDQIIGKTIYDFVDSRNLEIFEAELEARKRGKSGAYEIALRRPDGTNVSCLNNATPVYDENGVRIGSVGLWTDITELKEITKHLEQAKTEAESASNAKTLFLANMSHELRTPLNAIIGFSDTMKHGVFGEIQPTRYAGYISMISDAGSHLLELVSEILDMSKIEAEKYEIYPESLDFVDLANEALVMIRGRAEEAGVSVSLNESGDLPRVKADRQATRQALINLLTNAVKFTPRDGSVTINFVRKKMTVMAEISDTGIGIAPENIARAMMPFVQLERESGRTHEGAGLGLPLCKKLVELQGGMLSLDSEVGKGTRAMMSLPIHEAGSGERVGEAARKQ